MNRRTVEKSELAGAGTGTGAPAGTGLATPAANPGPGRGASPIFRYGRQSARSRGPGSLKPFRPRERAGVGRALRVLQPAARFRGALATKTGEVLRPADCAAENDATVGALVDR